MNIRLCLRPISTLCLLCALSFRTWAGPLLDIFSGTSQFVEDTSFVSPPEINRHAETTSILFNGQYKMYYRTFIQPNGSTGPNITGIALATSPDGNTWTSYNGGRPVLPNGAGGVGPAAVYAPNVIVDGTQLTMVYEADPGSSGLYRQMIAKAHSTDGINWTGHAIILRASTTWEGSLDRNGDGRQDGNVGTPSIMKVGSTYYVFYHGFTGVDAAGCLARGYASGTSLTAMTKYSGNPVLRGTTGTWNGIGIGRGDIVQEGSYYYMIFEGLKGSALCGPATTGWGLARSSNLRTWTHSTYNPIRTDRIGGGCGEDMPAWQNIAGSSKVITTISDLSVSPTVRRYKLSTLPPGKTTAAAVSLARTPSSGGYWQLSRDGGVFTFGNGAFHGSPGGTINNAVAIESTPSGNGYWVASSTGGIYTYGDAPFKGSMGGQPLNSPVVGLAASPSGQGYWMVASDGGMFCFGDAPFKGSMGGQPLNAPIVGMAPTPSGQGYWLVASDGGIFAFGDAAFHGSMGGQQLNAPISAMAATPNGQGYWMVGRDGGIFTFGNAAYFGSTGGFAPHPVIAMRISLDSAGNPNGYWLMAEDGGIIDFGATGGAVYHGHLRAAGFTN